MFRIYFTILVTAAFLSLHPASAQDSEKFDEPLSKKEAEQTLKLADEALENAERAQRRGDTPGMERALKNYSRHINKLERTIHGGNVLHDDHGDVAYIVADATSKHRNVLEGLLDTESTESKVPEEAEKGINTAIGASMKGHTTALANLPKDRQQELAQRHEQRGPSSGASSSRSDDSLHGSRPSTGPGTVGGPSRGGSQRGGRSQGGRGRR